MFSEVSPFDSSGDPAHFPASFTSAECPPSWVFQVSEREPALRVTYPPPLNAVAAFSALSPAQKSNPSEWWALLELNQ